MGFCDVTKTREEFGERADVLGSWEAKEFAEGTVE